MGAVQKSRFQWCAAFALKKNLPPPKGGCAIRAPIKLIIEIAQSHIGRSPPPHIVAGLLGASSTRSLLNRNLPSRTVTGPRSVRNQAVAQSHKKKVIASAIPINTMANNGMPFASVSRSRSILSIVCPLLSPSPRIELFCHGCLAAAHLGPINLRPIYLHKPARSFEWTGAQSPFPPIGFNGGVNSSTLCTRVPCGALLFFSAERFYQGLRKRNGSATCRDGSAVAR